MDNIHFNRKNTENDEKEAGISFEAFNKCSKLN